MHTGRAASSLDGVEVELEELEGEDTRDIEELSGIVKEDEMGDSIGGQGR